MSKYFSKDSDLLNYKVTDDNTIDTTSAIPSADNLTQPLSNVVKQQLSQTSNPRDANNDDEYINAVKQQTQQVEDMVKTYSEQSKREFKNHFERFAPAELFEKLNQLIFVVADLGNRISKLEEKIGSTPSISEPNVKKKLSISDPQDLYRLQQRMEELEKVSPQNIPNNSSETNIEQKIPTVDEVRKDLSDVMSGKKRSLPDEGYTDKSINLEELFPNLDDEAYQAAYSVMNSNKNSSATKEKPTPGEMRNLTGF